MSKLNELIEELCPNGVEYRKLGEVAKVLRGKRLTKKELSDSFQYPVFHGGIEPLGFYSQANRLANTVMIINVGASAGTVGFCNKEFWASDGCFCIEKNEVVNDRFLYFFCALNQSYFVSKVRKAGIPTLDATVIENLEIPVPPLGVQAEIVRILDKFTQLQTQLQTELQLRQKQYEYYRDKLLTNEKGKRKNEKWQMVKLGDVATIGTGSSNTNEEIENGVYPFYVRSQEVRKINSFEFDDKSIITAGDGVGVGKIFHLTKGKYALHQRAYRIHLINEDLLKTEFLFYYMKSKFHEYITRNQFKASVQSIRRPMLNNFEIPVPPLSEQERIVGILDRFEALCHDLSQGPPAEIAARQKQYEYYRDKLLTFKRKAG